jgi:hypothetical protein
MVKPRYWVGTMFYCDGAAADKHSYPDYYFFTPADVAAYAGCEEEEVYSTSGWFAKLGSGYPDDTTDWIGPFSSHDAARERIYAAFAVDPEEGIELDEWERLAGRKYVFRTLNDPRAAKTHQAWPTRNGGSTGTRKPPPWSVRNVAPPQSVPQPKKTQRLIDFLAGPKRRR